MKPIMTVGFAKVLAVGVLLAAAAWADEREDAALASAEQWLALVDAAEYANSWHAAAAAFQRQISAEAWEQAVSDARAPFGRVEERAPVTVQSTTRLPGVPDGEYVVIQFRTEFKHHGDGVETVTVMLEEGDWRVVGYFVR